MLLYLCYFPARNPFILALRNGAPNRGGIRKTSKRVGKHSYKRTMAELDEIAMSAKATSTGNV